MTLGDFLDKNSVEIASLVVFALVVWLLKD